MDSLYIVMPAYNEEANIESVIRSWYPLLEGKAPHSRLVVADRGSKDHTHDLLLKMQAENYPQLEIFENDNQFHGPKVIALYDHAVKNNIDYVFQTDSDGQTDPAEFESFWQERANYDGIFGYRPVRGDGRVRAFVEKVVCLLLRLYFHVKVPDANAPFRLMKTSTLAKYLDRLDKDYNLPNIMMTTYFVYFKEKTAFREITFKPRQGGKNSVDFRKIVKIGWKALGDFRHLKKAMRPSAGR